MKNKKSILSDDQKIIICQGLPASGKSTWATAMVSKNPETYKRVCLDDLRKMLASPKNMWSFKHGIDDVAITGMKEMARKILDKGYSLIVDNTNLNPKVIQEWINMADSLGIKYEFAKFTAVPIEELVKRDSLRVPAVGRKAIQMMYNAYKTVIDADIKNQVAPPKMPGTPENASSDDDLVTPVVPDPSLPSAIIVDMDGTLSLMNGRNPYDASTCDQDLLNIQVFKTLCLYKAAGSKVLIVTARDGKYLEPTKRFLNKWEVPYDDIFIRTENDSRKDRIVKRELFDAHIRGKYNVELVMDDRDQVVKLWRQLGLTTFQVAEGNF